MLKICMVSEVVFSRFGGTQKYLYYLSKELLKRGHDVTILSPQGDIYQTDVKVKAFNHLDFFWKLMRFRIVPRYRSEVKNYDIVHSHSHLFSALLTRHVNHFFVTTHGLRCSLNTKYGPIGWTFHKLITEPNLKAANEKGCIFCTATNDFYHTRRLGFENSYYVPIPIDIHPIQSADGKIFKEKYNIDSPIVLEVSRLCSIKGQLRFLQDCAEKIQRKTDVCFVFIGVKEEEKYLRQMEDEARKRGVNVRILPNLSDDEVYQAYQACDVFVLPSEFEGQAICVWEAFAAEKPVVATDVGGVKGASGKFAQMVPFWDPDKFSEKVISLLKNDGLRKELGEKAFKYVKQFSWSKVAEFVEQKYLETMNSSRPARL
jgi:glycosyltransferase involved in cell wall biosynthesis